MIIPVLATTYDEQEVRERLSPPLVRGVHALQGTHSAGWITTPEYEEALLQLFTQGAAAAAPTSTAPSPADSTSGGLGAQVATATARDTEPFCGPSPISPRDVLGAQVPTNSTTAHPVDQVRVQGVVKIETLPESPTMLQGPSRGLCPAQTSGSPMTLSSASAAGSASKADVNLECVEAGPSTQAPGSARQVAPALGAPLNAISNPNSKQTQHGNDRRFYFPDLLRAACHYRDHLPGDTQLHVIIARFPINPDGRLSVPESEAEVLLQDLRNNRAPKGLVLRRKGRTRKILPGAAYLARRTLALLRDAIDLDTARQAWESRLLPLMCRPPARVEIEFNKMELRKSALDILLQPSTANRRAVQEWEEAHRCFVGLSSKCKEVLLLGLVPDGGRFASANE